MTEFTQEVEELVSSYFSWLKDETRLKSFKDIDDVVAITTPHLDRHNDFLEIIVERIDNGFELSDDGYILSDLEASGCSINTPKRKAILKEVLNGFDVSLRHEILSTRANSENFAYKKHSLVQAMLAVNDMFFTASAHVKSFFFEDVREWLWDNEIPAIEGANFIGKSGFNHKYDFTIPRSRQRAERYIRTVNNPDKQAAQNIIMAWEDTRPARPEGAKAFVFLNDKKAVKNSIPNALREYGIEPILWGIREEAKEPLRL